MCQLTSPSLKMVWELPSAAGNRSTPTSTGSNSLAGARSCAARGIMPGHAGMLLSTSPPARTLRRASAVNEIKHQTDHLRRDEEDLCTVGQANEEIKAAENSDHSDHRSGRS